MQKGYKCDYCSRFFTDKAEAQEHEENCRWNPQLRGCLSCGNREVNIGYGGEDLGDKCKAGVDFDTREDIEFERKPCDKWIPIENEES